MPLVANAGIDKTVYVGEAMRLDGSTSTEYIRTSQSGGTWSVQWQTGDGFDVENTIKVGHIYQTAGTYTATLTVKNAAGAVSTDTAIITVLEIPTALAADTVTLTDTGNLDTNRNNLQAAINTAAASPNTREIIVPAGFIFNDPLYLRPRTATNYVTIRVSDLTTLPPKVRVTGSVADKAKLFRMNMRGKIIAGEYNALTMNLGAKYYRIIGMEIRNTVNVAYAETDMIGNEYTVDYKTNNSNFIYDRCLMNGNGFPTTKGAVLNGVAMSLLNSSVLDIKAAGIETKAVAQWDGAGPLAVVNNRLEAGAINSLVGGASDPGAANILDGYVFRGNHVWKNPAWVGGGWNIKNHFELKQGLNVTVVGNVFENMYVDGQTGESIMLFSMTDDGCSSCETGNVDFRNNKILNTRAGFNLTNVQAYTLPAPPYAHHMRLYNNFIEEREDRGNLQQGANYSEITNNTFVIRPGSAFKSSWMYFSNTGVSGPATYKAPGFKLLNNIAYASEYGVIADSTAPGNASLDATLPAAREIRKNIIPAADIGSFPADNFYPATVNGEFVDYAGGNFNLKSTSVYKNAGTDGTDLGVNWAVLTPATATALSGAWGSTVSLPTPAAPGFVSQDDAANTYVFTPTSGYTATAHEYAINGGAFQNATSSTISVGDVAIPVGSLVVRVKEVAGVNNAGATRSNATAFTVAGGGNTVPSAPTITQSDSANTISATHALGASEILKSENSAAFVQYDGAVINVGDVARAAGYYRFKIKAAAGRDESAIASSAGFTVAGGGGSSSIAAPTASAGVPQSHSAITVSWTQGVPAGTTVTKNRICRADNSAMTTNLVVFADITARTAWTDTSCAENKQYFYQVAAGNAVDLFSAYSSAAPATTPAKPARPTRIKVKGWRGRVK